MKISRLVIALFAAFLMAVPALAEQVRITADRFVIEENATTATFTGNVEIVQGDMIVHAAKVIVHYGTGGASDIERLEAVTNVVIDTPSQHITGQRADYDPGMRVMIVTGNVVSENDTGRVTSEKMRVDLNANTTEFDTGNGGRVTGVFNP